MKDDLEVLLDMAQELEERILALPEGINDNFEYENQPAYLIGQLVTTLNDCIKMEEQ